MLFFEVVTWLLLGLLLGTARWYLEPTMNAAGWPMAIGMAGALIGGAIGRIASPAPLGGYSALALLFAGVVGTMMLAASRAPARKE